MASQNTTVLEEASSDITAQVAAAKTRLIAEAQLVGTLANLAVVALVAGLLWGTTPQAQMIAWLGCVVVSSLLVMAGAEQFRLNLPLWYRFLNGRLLALSWGLSAVLVFPANDFASQVLLLMLVSGVASGHLMVTAVWFSASIWILPLALGPFIIRFLVDAGPFAVEVAVALATYSVILSMVARNMSRALTDNLLLTFRNEELVASLAEASARQEKLLAQTEQAFQAAERSNQAKTRFLAAASHDLRQPMQALTFLVSALEKQATAEADSNLISDTKRTLESINGLLTSLLDISRFDAGVVAVQREPFPVSDILDALGRELAEVALSKDLQLRIRPSDLWIDSDPALLSRILRNLINNALKYTSDGGVLVGCRKVGDNVRIQVWDTGPGIAPEHHEEIFHEFFQLRQPDKDFQSGLGLGLTIVNRIANLLEHPIRFRTVVGKGSCFSVDVPLAQPVQRDHRAGTPPHEGVTDLRSLSGRVLAVDDETSVLTGLEAVLTGMGLDVEVGKDPATASERVREGFQPDVIITDYRLGEDVVGTDVVNQINAIVGSPVPAIIITGDTGPDRLRDLTGLGFSVLHKPVSPEALYDALLDVLSPKDNSVRPARAVSGS